MNRVGTVMKMHARDKWSWFYIPWLILFSSFLVNLIVGYFVRNLEPGGTTTGGIIAIFIYMFFAGLFILPQTFSFALGFSVTRKDYFLGTSAMIGLIGAMTVLILFLIGMIETGTSGWGLNLFFFNMPFLEELSWILQTLLYFWTMIHLYAFGLLISSIHRRFGRNGMYVFFIALILITSVIVLLATVQNWWIDLYEWVIRFSFAEFFNGMMLWEAGLSIVYLLLIYLLLRRAPA